MRVINVPIESIPDRYSEQWNRWFPAEFNRLNVPYESVCQNDCPTTIERGRFLDTYKTNLYKSSQISAILRRLSSLSDDGYGDVYFFHDLWFPGIEALQYVRDCAEKRYKIAGILHAGTYDPSDYLTQCGMRRWGIHIERAWYELVDAIFVATRYHRDLICKGLGVSGEKIHVTGLPIFDEFSDSTVQRNKIIVFPHRLDPEKHPELFDDLCRLTKQILCDYQYVKTKEVISRSDYYAFLNSCDVAVSYADQETFGIAQREAVLCGCIPLVPDRIAYAEDYPSVFKYRTFQESVDKLYDIIARHDDYLTEVKILREGFIRAGSSAIETMVSIMNSL